MNAAVVMMIKQSGRSWWQARYSDGRVRSEWETGTRLLGRLLLPLALNSKTSRWEEVPKKNMVGLRLLCPNGMAGELEAPEGHKFFQLKAGGLSVGAGHFQNAHIIGVVRDANGNCLCRAWETAGDTPVRLIEFEDNIYAMKYCQIGRLSIEVQGLKV